LTSKDYSVDQIYLKISEREESIGWDHLTNAEQTFAIVMNMDYEVGNGGLMQYYYNSTGNDATYLHSALCRIGADKIAKIIQEINSYFGSDGPKKDRNARIKQLASFSKSIKEKIYEYDKYILNGPENIEELLLYFSEKNKLYELLQ